MLRLLSLKKPLSSQTAGCSSQIARCSSQNASSQNASSENVCSDCEAAALSAQIAVP